MRVLCLLLLALMPLAAGASAFDDSAPTTINFDATKPGAIGGVTPGAGAFTALSATSTTDAKAQLFVNNSSGSGTAPFATFVAGSNTITPAFVTERSAVPTHSANEALYGFGASGTNGLMYFLRARGTASSPSALLSGDSLGNIVFDGFDGTNYQGSSGILAAVDGTVSTAVMPTRLDFLSTSLAGNTNIRLSLKANGNLVFTMPTLAATTLTASTEQVSYNFNDSSTKTFPTGDFATQRGTVFQAPTYAATAASTITTAATLDVTAAPTCNANMTCTHAYAVNIEAGTSRFVGSVALGSAHNSGHLNLSTGSGTVTVDSGADCTCTDQTDNTKGVKCPVSGTTATFTGNASDLISYVCFAAAD